MTRVWFNQSFSSIHGVLRQIRSGWTANDGDLELFGSHSNRHFAPFVECDITEMEPTVGDAEYVEWCLDFCRRRQVNVFVPGRRRDVIADHKSEFHAVGTRLIVAGDGNTLRLLEDKGRFLEALPPEMPTHRFERARTWEEFERALGKIDEASHRVCVKPAHGTFGIGFYVLNDHLTPLRRLLSAEAHIISRRELLGILKDAESFPEMLVMEYLDGPEMSVDVLAQSGQVVAMMVRRKPTTSPMRITGTSRTQWTDEGPYQILDRHLEVEEKVRDLVSHFCLDGLLNIQFRSRAEIPESYCLLEINGRMSGGLPYVGLTGLNLPVLAVKMALLERGAPWPEIPEIELPIRVGTFTEAFAVTGNL